MLRGRRAMRAAWAWAVAFATVARAADPPATTRPALTKPSTTVPAYVRPPPASLPLPAVPGEHKLKFTTRVAGRPVTISYLLKLPPAYADARQRPPLLVFFHGIGEVGTDLAGVYPIGPMTVLRGDGQSQNPAMAATSPFAVLCPQCPPRGEQWNTDYVYRTTAELVAAVVRSTHVDPDRVYATGLSMGGQGTWCVAEQAPDLFAAVAPLSAMAWQADAVADRLRAVPVWTITGLQDEPRFVDGNRSMERALAGVNGADRFTYAVHDGHWAFAKAFASPQFYEWFLDHRRRPAGARPTPPAPAVPTAPGHYALAFDTMIGDQPYQMDYVLYVPRRSANPATGRRPAMLFLHERDTIGPAPHGLAVHGPDLALDRHAALRESFPSVVVSPRLPVGCDWNTPGLPQAIAGLLDHVAAAVPIDPDRVCVTGVDAGAAGAVHLAEALPGRFAALAWVSTRPDVTPPGDVAHLALPGRAFVPDAGRARQLNDAYKASGQNWHATALPPGVSPLGELPAYTDRAVLEWLARQRRKPA